MSSWAEFERDAPELASRVRQVLDSRRHKTLATLRRDGSPRVSGIELELRDGEAVLGMMPGSVKLGDLLRDPRLAVHATSDDPPPGDPSAWAGDAKVSGRAVRLPDIHPTGEAPRFRVEIAEVVLTRVGSGADHLVIESWHPGREASTILRR